MIPMDRCTVTAKHIDDRWVSIYQIPSGKRLHNYGNSPFSMGKSTISTGPCSIAM